MLSKIAPHLGRFVEARWKLSGTHIEKGLFLSRCLTASVSHHSAVFCSGYLAIWLFGEPHSVVLLDGRHPHRHPQATMLGYER